MTDEQQITIDGVSYSLSDLSETARNHIANVRVCEQRLGQLQQELAITRTARAAYAAALKEALPAAQITEAPAEQDAATSADATVEDTPADDSAG